jgi:glycogen synthase
VRRAIECYKSPGCVRRMQKEAVLRIQENHTWDRVMKRYMQLYKKARKQRTTRLL